MRLVAWLVCVVCGSYAFAQPCTQVPFAADVPNAAPAAPLEPRLARHLVAWEQAAFGVSNCRFELELTRKFPGVAERVYTGALLVMKPNLARLRLDLSENPKDFEAIISTGKKTFTYSALQKTVIEGKLPANYDAMLSLIAVSSAKSLTDRFTMSVFKEDAHYTYLDLKPANEKFAKDFQLIRVAIYGPETPHAYLPAQIYLLHPNGATEQWKFTKPHVNLPGIDEKMFQYENVPGFSYQKAPEEKSPAPEAVAVAESQIVCAPPGTRVVRGPRLFRFELFRK